MYPPCWVLKAQCHRAGKQKIICLENFSGYQPNQTVIQNDCTCILAGSPFIFYLAKRSKQNSLLSFAMKLAPVISVKIRYCSPRSLHRRWKGCKPEVRPLGGQKEGLSLVHYVYTMHTSSAFSNIKYTYLMYM